MAFCTAISCMDGRIQLPVIRYLQRRFQVDYVDTITEPGPNGILARQDDAAVVDSIRKRLQISVENHRSVGIAVVGHYDCAGNPAPPEQQHQHLKQAVHWVRQLYPQLEVIALWVDEHWQVHELTDP
ncbi:MAG: hypothetical protein GXO78_03240 [Calditrichaeota bacterium]|nr:hypothetical protein [Calditrichota bacterium]